MSFLIKRDDTSPSLVCRLEAPPGTPIDLTGATVAFHMTATLGGPHKVIDTATIVDATEGRVRYDWDPADTDTVGRYYAEWHIVFGDGATQTVPTRNYLWVRVLPPCHA